MIEEEEEKNHVWNLPYNFVIECKIYLIVDSKLLQLR